MGEETLSNTEKQVLLALNEHGGRATPEEVMQTTDLEMVKVMNASSWLQSKGLVTMHEELRSHYQITGEGKRFLSRGLPEENVLQLVLDGVADFASLQKKTDDLGIAVGWLRRKGWCDIQRRDGEKALVPTEDGEKALASPLPEKAVLQAVSQGREVPDEQVLRELVQRGAVEEKECIVRTIMLTERGREAAAAGLEITDEIVQLTPQLIRSGEWRKKEFRPYDVRAFAPAAFPGKRHPLMQLVERIRRIFVEMGFTEITGGFVESCFWDMDVLFIPQDHPARDMQDTFYCSHPASMEVDKKLLRTIARVHENGGDTGSQGWGYTFSPREAERVLLRTHTTVNTIRYLAHNPEPPAKIFSIGKVFRKENIDSTHLPEFYQVEGIVYEEDADFGELIGILHQFYAKMGFRELRFRPSYYPYTEPSMDVEARWQGKWMELGGSGIFRPEVTEPLGIQHPVLAWGLGLERMALNMLDVQDIRELYLSDIQWLQRQPLL